MSKYGSNKVYYNGIEFASRKEYVRYRELELLEMEGRIDDLELQKPFELVPAQYEPSTEVYKRGEKKGQPKQGKLLEQAINYVADFCYKENGELVVEDVKGYKGGGAYEVFTIKRKLMLYKYGIKIKEI